MKNLLTNSISTTVGFPVKSGTLDFLQTASSEMLNALARSIIGRDFSTSVPYALYGCNNTGSGSSYVIEAGAILWNGVLYLVPAVSFTLTGGNSVYVSKSTSYVTSSVADPVTFTDGVARNVHADTIMNVYQSAIAPSPTGGFAYSSLVLIWEMPYITVSSYISTYYSSGTAKYKKNQDGLVSLSGRVTLTTNSSTFEELFALNINYLPTSNIRIPVMILNGGTVTIGSILIDISTNVVWARSVTGTNLSGATIYLDGVSYYNN